MTTVIVHHIYDYDGTDDISHVSKWKLSADRIKALGKEIVPDTAEEVDASALDDYGRYDPRQSEKPR